MSIPLTEAEEKNYDNIETKNNQTKIIDHINRAIEIKKQEKQEIDKWFEHKYIPGETKRDVVKEWDKRSIEVTAQLKILNHILSL